jgi:[acyl-carrier-protein] S-malonyltransferase
MPRAFVFPGQGSQVVGMGADVAQHSPAAQHVFTIADQALGWSLSELCFQGTAETLTATQNTQPALVATSLAVLAALAGDVTQIAAFTKAHAVAVAGHSLGEYSALAAAGSLTVADAVTLVRRRGELMAAASAGGMAAVIGLDDDTIDAICQQASTPEASVVVANYNSPGQTVISGATSAIATASELLKQAGAKRVLPLNVSAAFHSPLMDDAATQLSSHVAQTAMQLPLLPVIGNITASPLVDVAAIRQELPAQVISPVRWVSTINALVAQGVDEFVEIGAGTVLSGLIKRIAPQARTTAIADYAGVVAFQATL